MTHELGHLECGGAGKILRWATLIDGDKRIPIPVYERAFVNIIWFQHGIEHKQVAKINDLIKKFREKFYSMVAQPGEPVYYETPHPPDDVQ